MAKKNKQLPLDILKTYGINLQQEMFCQYFTSPSEFYGNGVQSYASAYGFDITDAKEYNVAKSRASQLLSNINICNRINSLLDTNGFNDNHVDKQLLMLVTQSADFNAKLGAIREYNKLKSRITERMEHAINVPVAIIEITQAPDRVIKAAVEVPLLESAQHNHDNIEYTANGEELPVGEQA